MGHSKHFLLSFIILIYSPSSFGFHEEDSISKFPIKNFLKSSQILARGRERKKFSVDDFGAKADGTDDSKAFKRTWKKACCSKGSRFVVPRNKVYHLKPTNFSGPCHPGFTVKIYGTIKATINQSDYDFDREQRHRHWLVFENLQNFTVRGGGTIDGNGRGWWENSCKIKINGTCNKYAPTAVTFFRCNHLKVKHIRMENSQRFHISIENSQNAKVSNLFVVAPHNSPNTDGIHILGTLNIHISNSVIMTGDDCVSIINGSKNVLMTNLRCGPGHGISIGSLGKDNVEDHVSDVRVDGATILNTTNGLRIKSWQGGSGSASNIKFLNIKMHNVSNPIIIDQNYCDREQDCPQQYMAVQIKDVLYKNIKGTTESEMAIKLDCSKTFPCQMIQLQNVVIRSHEDGVAKASFSKVKLRAVTAFY